MRVQVGGRRSFSDPLAGVTFTAAERAEVARMAARLSALPLNDLAALSQAVRYDALRLDGAAVWTCGETEHERSTQHVAALKLVAALDAAWSSVAGSG